MKHSSMFILLAVALVGTACERHSADSLPSHDGGHAAKHEGAPAAAHAPAAVPAPAGGEHKAEPKKAEAAPAAGEAPKFFQENKPAK